MIEAKNIAAGYDKVMILNDVSIKVDKGESICIIGRNGVGKSTFMKTLIGINKAEKGSITLEGADITKMKANVRANKGVGYVPQGHGVFPNLTVEENLKMGLLINCDGKSGNFDMVYEYFPILKKRRKQAAGTMSGGEQAMLSIGRVLIGNPKVLLLDEPSEGVQPNVVLQMGEIVNKIAKELKLTTILVEQHMGLVQQIGKRGYVMDKGAIIAELTFDDIQNQDTLRKYLTV